MRVLVRLVFGILVTCWIGVAQARDDFGWTLDDAKALVKDLTGRALELKGCVPGVVHDGQDCAFFGKGPSQYQTNWEFEVSPEGNVAGVVLRYFTDDGLDLGRPSDARFPGQAIAGVVAVAAGKGDTGALLKYLLAMFNKEVLPPKPAGLMIMPQFLGDGLRLSIKTPYFGSSRR